MDTEEQLEKMCNDYVDIFLKHVKDVGKTDLVQKSLQSKAIMKLLD